MKGSDKMKKFIMCLLTTLMLNQPIYANDLKEIKMSILDDKIKAVKVFESTEDIDFKNVVFADFEKDNFKYVKDSINVDRITKEDKKEQTEVLSFILTNLSFVIFPALISKDTAIVNISIVCITL